MVALALNLTGPDFAVKLSKPKNFEILDSKIYTTWHMMNFSDRLLNPSSAVYWQPQRLVTDFLLLK